MKNLEDVFIDEEGDCFYRWPWRWPEFLHKIGVAESISDAKRGIKAGEFYRVPWGEEWVLVEPVGKRNENGVVPGWVSPTYHPRTHERLNVSSQDFAQPLYMNLISRGKPSSLNPKARYIEIVDADEFSINSKPWSTEIDYTYYPSHPTALVYQKVTGKKILK